MRLFALYSLVGDNVPPVSVRISLIRDRIEQRADEVRHVELQGLEHFQLLLALIRQIKVDLPLIIMPQVSLHPPLVFGSGEELGVLCREYSYLHSYLRSGKRVVGEHAEKHRLIEITSRGLHEIGLQFADGNNQFPEQTDTFFIFHWWEAIGRFKQF